jgi:hypothetical protein
MYKYTSELRADELGIKLKEAKNVKAKETKKCHHRQLMQLSVANCDE